MAAALSSGALASLPPASRPALLWLLSLAAVDSGCVGRGAASTLRAALARCGGGGGGAPPSRHARTAAAGAADQSSEFCSAPSARDFLDVLAPHGLVLATAPEDDDIWEAAAASFASACAAAEGAGGGGSGGGGGGGGAADGPANGNGHARTAMRDCSDEAEEGEEGAAPPGFGAAGSGSVHPHPPPPLPPASAPPTIERVLYLVPHCLRARAGAWAHHLARPRTSSNSSSAALEPLPTALIAECRCAASLLAAIVRMTCDEDGGGCSAAPAVAFSAAAEACCEFPLAAAARPRPRRGATSARVGDEEPEGTVPRPFRWAPYDVFLASAATKCHLAAPSPLALGRSLGASLAAGGRGAGSRLARAAIAANAASLLLLGETSPPQPMEDASAGADAPCCSAFEAQRRLLSATAAAARDAVALVEANASMTQQRAEQAAADRRAAFAAAGAGTSDPLPPISLSQAEDAGDDDSPSPATAAAAARSATPPAAARKPQVMHAAILLAGAALACAAHGEPPPGAAGVRPAAAAAAAPPGGTAFDAAWRGAAHVDARKTLLARWKASLSKLTHSIKISARNRAANAAHVEVTRLASRAQSEEDALRCECVEDGGGGAADDAALLDRADVAPAGDGGRGGGAGEAGAAGAGAAGAGAAGGGGDGGGGGSDSDDAMGV